VKVVKTEHRSGRSLHLVGRLLRETESTASGEGLNIVFKTQRRRDRDTIITLAANHAGEILAFEGDSLIGLVVWDDRTNARKLPVFMRRLLGVSP